MDLSGISFYFTNLTLFGAAGLFGVGLYITIYSLLQLGVLRGASYTYTMMNLVAASSVLASLTETFNLSATIIQVTWIVISVICMIRLYIVKNLIRFDAKELVFIKTKLPGLANDQAKKFLKLGNWKSGYTGETLIWQGKPVGSLCYLARGKAEVYIDGQISAVCEKGDFMGEITYLSGAPATATVVLSAPSTYFCIEVDIVRKLAKSNGALHDEIEKSVANDLRSKFSRGPVAVQKFQQPVAGLAAN